jgi:uncharacterized repeat protein (TIGR01451 family)
MNYFRKKSILNFFALSNIHFLLVLIALCLLLSNPANARLIGDPLDPDLTGAGRTIVPLDESIGLTFGEKTFQTVQNGVTFDFNTTNASGLFMDVDPAGALAASPPEGIEVSINPPVAAIGFVLRYSTCTGLITFTGALGSETFESQDMPSDLFIGAADIGDISSVTLNASCVVSLWSDMLFVPSSGGPQPPLSEVDLGISKAGPPGQVSQTDSPVNYNMVVENLGPDTDTATGAQVVDFLPPGASVVSSDPPAILNAAVNVATINLGDIAAGDSGAAFLGIEPPPFEPNPGVPWIFGCEDTLLNVALTTSNSIETDHSNNFSIYANSFDKASRSGSPEICGNGIDDNCDGLVDFSCGGILPFLAITHAPGPGPTVFPPPGGLPPGTPTPPEETSAGTNNCWTSHGTIQLPAYCCGQFPPTTTECAPQDPNFKESDPPTNALGYGYTKGGQLMEYTLHYENIGGVDAHNVSIIDVLNENLDETTLVVNDGGTYEPASRTILWSDPVVPPATPRSVSFSVNVRSDALPTTRIHNVGTIIFPDAIPPSRIDTNFVEHVVVDPQYPVVEDLKVFRCNETGPGTNEWSVDIVNEGFGFAYNVTATIVNPPASVLVTEGTASFAHPDDALSPPNPSPILTDNGDGTVTQIRNDGSVLMWLNDPLFAQTAGYDTDGFMTWDEANAWITYLNTTDFDNDGIPGYANHNNWRLPQTLPINGTSYHYNFNYDGSTDNSYNITSPNSEMAYLFYVELGNLGAFDTSGIDIPLGFRLPFNTGPFPYFPQNSWSSTELSIAADQAWLFDFLGGRQFFLPKNIGLNAWAVRNVPPPDAPTTVVPLAYTTSTDTVTFTTEAPVDICDALVWRICYTKTNSQGEEIVCEDVQAAADADIDAVADHKDNCPNDFNPTQIDSDGNGIGDVCDLDNVAPSVDAGPDETIDEGETFNGSGSFSDPGADTWTATVDYGDGSGVQALGLSPDKTFNLSNVYADDGVYVVTVTVSDDDGGVGSDTLTVTVNNVAPTVQAGSNQTINEGDTISLDPATFTDPGVLDTHTATIGWGDGTVEPGTVTEAGGSGSVEGSHIYPVAGTYTVTVTVTDKDGGVGSDTFMVEVSGTQPVSDLTARAKDGKIDVVWTHVGAASYNIYRSDGGGSYTLIANTTSTYSVYADFGLTNGMTYCYKVRLLNAQDQESADSNEACATPSSRRRR